MNTQTHTHSIFPAYPFREWDTIPTHWSPWRRINLGRHEISSLDWPQGTIQSQHTLTVTWSYADETTFPVNPAAGLWAASMAAADTDLHVEAVDTEIPETPLILKCQTKACSHRNNVSSVNNNTIVVAWALAKAMHIIASTVR